MMKMLQIPFLHHSQRMNGNQSCRSGSSRITPLMFTVIWFFTSAEPSYAQRSTLRPHQPEAQPVLANPDLIFSNPPAINRQGWKSLDPHGDFNTPEANVDQSTNSDLIPLQADKVFDSPETSAIQTVNFQVISAKADDAPIVVNNAAAPGHSPPAPAVSAGESSAAPANLEDHPVLLTLEEIQKRQATIEAQKEMADDVKAPLILAYQHAAESLKLIAESVKKSAELKAERDQGPEFIKAARMELEQPASKADLELPAAITITDMEQARLREEELANETQKNLEAWETRAKVRAERKPQMPSLIEKTKQQLAETKKSLQAPNVEGELPWVTLARKTDQESLVMLFQQQLEQYRIEQSRYEALNELFPLRRDLLVRQKSYYDKRLENWKIAITEARRLESERQAREAKFKLRNTHPALRELAERNAMLTQDRKRLQDGLNSAAETLKEINAKSEELSGDLQDIKNKESLGALSTGAGMLLRNQRNRLPEPAKYRQTLRFSGKEIARLQLELMPLQDERDRLGDLESYMETLLSEMKAQHTISDTQIRDMARDLLNDRRSYLDDLLSDYSHMMAVLGEMDVSSGRLVETIVEYQKFIDERVLWIRSAGVVNVGTFPRTVSGAADIFSAKNFEFTATVLKEDLHQNKSLYMFAFVAAITVLGLSRRIRKLILSLSQRTKRAFTANATSSLSALGLTLVVASVWPVLLWLIGWRLTSVSANDFTVAAGSALQVTAIAFWTMEVLRQICRKRGIAETFLGWDAKSMGAIHGNLLILTWTSLPLMFLTVISDEYHEGYWADSVGRMAFVAFCGVLLTASIRVLRPSGQILGNLLRASQEGLMYRTQKIWYPLSILAPLALGVMAIFGYQYTAEQLLIRLQFTFWLSISLLISYTLVFQWMLTIRRKIALAQARERRAVEAKHNAQVVHLNSPVPPVENPKLDLTALNQQMTKLLRVVACVIMLSGSWMIWSEVMPALQVFNRVELWSTTVQVVETFDVGDGQQTLRSVPQQKWITLGDILFAIGLVAVAILGSKNLPGLLELSLLQRLPLDHGERNAVTTLCRYACVLLGVILASQTIGIGWSSVQWLIAALTVGLGFGLQEIFANFVSGLIILFERPIRIGDVVTIDNVTGSVSKIQIRATTIIDWDRKEYIVPNKEFVTGRLLNWTLSDKTNRVVVEVGVAYGVDTDLALELLNRVALEHAIVLKDPAPIASFEGFGDSCLSLKLRVYLPNLDNRLNVITDLHLRIDREFRQAGIEIAFPQMDLHIRSMPSHEMKLPFIRVPVESAEDERAA